MEPPVVGEVKVRPARPEDMPLVHRMIYELAEYEGMPDGPQLTVEDLLADGFGERAWFFVLVGEVGGVVQGYALANRAYSSWTRRALYLEDLYVRPNARRRGLARLLLRTLCELALREGVHRIDWHVLRGNQPAERFYDSLGACNLSTAEGRDPLRLYRPEIETLAGEYHEHTDTA